MTPAEETTTAPGARIAAAPITWGVNDVAGWGHQLPPDRVLREMASLGVEAIETGPDGFLPEDAAAARGLVANYGLTVVGGYVGLMLHGDPAVWRDELEPALDRLGALGAEWIIAAALEAPGMYDRRPELQSDDWRRLLAALDQATELARQHGLRLAVHPHLATVIERPEDVQRVLDGSTAVLCLDTGHYTVGGGDAVALAREAGERIGYVHLKDVDARLADAVREGRMGFLDAVRDGLFRPLGQGDVDVETFLRTLVEARYDGWLVLEQDVMLDAPPPPGAGPVENARISGDYIRSLIGR